MTELGFDTKGITLSDASAISPNGKYVGGIGLAMKAFGVTGFLIQFPDHVLGSQEVAPKGTLTVYPNPETIHFRSTEAVLSAEIYNMAGQLVTSVAKVADNKINAQSLAKEMYIVKVQTAAGTQTVKILKD